jgi:hypothetical protein
MLHGIFGTTDVDAIEGSSDQGWLFCAPALPATAADATRAVEILERTVAESGCDRQGITVGHTLNLLPADWIDLVVSVRFTRDARVVGHAHRLLDDLHDVFGRAGYGPYRLDIDHMGSEQGDGGDVGRDLLLGRIRSELDAGNRISRGRYERT